MLGSESIDRADARTVYFPSYLKETFTFTR